MLPGSVRIVGRIDENTFHPTGINRQETFEGIQVITLDQEVFGAGVTVIEGRDRYQRAVGHGAGRLDGIILA
jgi:hypothetical protein